MQPLHIVIAAKSQEIYHGLIAGLADRGHHVLFLERRVAHAPPLPDLGLPQRATVARYRTLADLRQRWASDIRGAELVIVGSHVQQGATLGIWITKHARGVTMFHDLDTHTTLDGLDRGDCPYLSRPLVKRFHAYLTSATGPVQRRLAADHGARLAQALPRWLEPAGRDSHNPPGEHFDLGHLGDPCDPRRSLLLDRLLIESARRYPAGRFAVAGETIPAPLPPNVARVGTMTAAEHQSFYASCSYLLDAGSSRGWAPCASLLEAAASGTPVISDEWPGIETFFVPGKEVLVSRSPGDTLSILRGRTDQERRDIGARGRERVLREHTGTRRAEQLESTAAGLLGKLSSKTAAA